MLPGAQQQGLYQWQYGKQEAEGEAEDVAAVMESLDLANCAFEYEQCEARLRQSQAKLETAKNTGGHSPAVIQQLQAACERLQGLLR